MDPRASRRSVLTALGLILALVGSAGAPLGGARAATATTPPRVLIVGPLDGYGALIAGVFQGLQAGGFNSPADVQIEVRNVQSP